MLEIHLVLSEVTCLVPANGQNGSTVNKTNFLNKTSKLEKKENLVFKKSEITDKSDTHGNILKTLVPNGCNDFHRTLYLEPNLDVIPSSYLCISYITNALIRYMTTSYLGFE